MIHPDPTTTNSCRIIAMLNQKGGVGKTTSTVNIGAALALADRRVCLIDLDPQAHLTLHLGIDEDQIERTVYDLIIDPQCTAEETIVNARPNLDVILAEVDLAGAETELAREPDRQRRLSEKLAPILHRYDVVLMDCPPSLGLLTLNALATAQEVFVPMQTHFLALQGVGKLLETVGLVCRSVNEHLSVGAILLCMHEGQTTLAQEVVTDLEEFFEQARGQDVPWSNCRILEPPIRRNIKLAEAPSFGQTIFDYSPWCRGAIDYRRLVRQLLETWVSEAESTGNSTIPLIETIGPSPAELPTTTVETKPLTESSPNPPQPGEPPTVHVGTNSDAPMPERTLTDASPPGNG